MKHERVELPSGKTVIRLFNDDGSLYQENHSYGLLEIAVKYEFRDGNKIQETYFSKRKLASRRTYEKARAAYSDMPAANNALEDWGAKIVKGMAEEKRLHRAESKKHTPNQEKARKSDDFCTRLMSRGKQSEVRDWIKDKRHMLGEMNWPQSKRLVDRLISLGCRNVYACEIDSYEDEMENTGHLVIELPTDSQERKNILKEVDNLAGEQGYSGPFDDGQRFVYVKLD